MTTAVVILNWNGRNFLEKYLPSVLNSTSGMKEVSVIVADNASEDDSVQFLKDNFPSVGILNLGRNWGFAEGYNKALSKIDTDLFLLLNSDVETPRGWLDTLVEWMQLHPDCGICGPKLHCTDDRERFEYSGAAGGFLDKWGFPICRGRSFNFIENDEGQYDIPADVLWISGAALMIRRSLFLSLGGFCKDFFAHMEEIDLCWRARQEGWRVCVVPRSTVFHVGGGTLPQSSSQKTFLNFRNNLLMLSRNLPVAIALQTAFNVLSRLAGEDVGDCLEPFILCSETCRRLPENVRKELLVFCSEYGIRKTRRIVFARKMIDLAAAAVYLLSGRKSHSIAVVRAHREYRLMKRPPSAKKIRGILSEVICKDGLDIARRTLVATEHENAGYSNFGKGMFRVRGIWDKWSIWQAVFKKESIFAEIKDIV